MSDVKIPEAGRELGLGPAQVKKLIAARMLDVVDPAEKQLRITRQSLDRILHISSPHPPPAPVLALHLAPLARTSDTDRRWLGYSKGWHPEMNELDSRLAWTRWWPVGAEGARELVGGYIAGDIAGVIPKELVAQVVGFQCVAGGSVAFEVEPCSLPGLSNTRFKPRPGPIVEWLRQPSPAN